MRETMILILILIATTAEGRDLILSAPLEPVQSTTVYTIILISPIINPNSGTCKITSLFLNAGTHVRPGALVDVTIKSDRGQVN